MPSELFVEVCRINQIDEHPNADRLELALVKGWQCVVQKGLYKVGDKVVYFPIDSVLTEELEDTIFGEDSKVKLKGRRIRTIKLRGAISQGLVVPISELEIDSNIEVGTSLREMLKVTKYTPPTRKKPKFMLSEPAKRRAGNDNFSRYTKINHLSNFPLLFRGEEVLVHEKIHGTNFRAGLLNRTPKNWWEKVKMFFAKGKPEFVYGSHRVQLKNKDEKAGFYPKNVYWKAVVDYEIQDKLKHLRRSVGDKDIIIYGEVYGPGIQGSDYGYGVPQGSIRLVVFDIKVDGCYVQADLLREYCAAYDFTMPYMFTSANGELFNIHSINRYVCGKSKLNHSMDPNDAPVIEGVVVRTLDKGRRIGKFLNPDFLLNKDNSEWS